MAEENIKKAKIHFWSEYWPTLQQTTRDTERYIDKKVYGIAAGGIGIEIASLQYIGDVCFKWIALLSGICFTTTLILNLLSHVKSLKSQEKEGDAIQLFIKTDKMDDDSHIYDLIQSENRCITRINHWSIYIMVIAIISLLYFIIINI